MRELVSVSSCHQYNMTNLKKCKNTNGSFVKEKRRMADFLAGRRAGRPKSNKGQVGTLPLFRQNG